MDMDTRKSTKPGVPRRSAKPAPSLNKNVLSLSDDEDAGPSSGFKINDTYAKKYDDWRAKEEMQKLKDRYGDQLDVSSSSSESEDETAEALTPQIEKDFFRTLSILKRKDPSIYDKSVTFFHEQDAKAESEPTGSKSSKPMFLKDFERKVILEKGGIIDEDSESRPARFQSTYDQEQQELKRKLAALAEDSDDEDLFKPRAKTDEEVKQEESEYSAWLRGSGKDLEQPEDQEALKPLKEFWTDPSLEEGEKFLRDYILEKKYLGQNTDRIPTYGEIVDEHFSEEETELEKAEEFEHKYNFRFEEPDPEFIKRYPRTMDESLRRKDDKRKVKRDEVKERKDAEKDRAREDIKQLKSLKKRELMQKIEKLQAISGQNSLAIDENELEDDFDPEAHDKMMQKMFDEEYYGHEDDLKKPDLSDESDVDEDWAVEKELMEEDEEDGDEVKPGVSEQKAVLKEDEPSTSDGRKSKRKRRTLVSEAVQKSKPVFDPNDKKLQEYLDEYYKLDFEDVVGGTACRFKYRSVVPNDFGLTPEEILKAPDRELNAWSSLKKAVQYRSEEEEMYDLRAFKQKASLRDLKSKIMPSLAENEPTKIDTENVTSADGNQSGKKRRRRKKKTKAVEENQASKTTEDNVAEILVAPEVKEAAPVETVENGTKQKKRKRESQPETAIPSGESKTSEVSAAKESIEKSTKKRRKRMNKNKKTAGVPSGDPVLKKQKTLEHEQFLKSLPSARVSDERLRAYGLHPKKFRQKEKYVLLAKKKEKQSGEKSADS